MSEFQIWMQWDDSNYPLASFYRFSKEKIVVSILIHISSMTKGLKYSTMFKDKQNGYFPMVYETIL